MKEILLRPYIKYPTLNVYAVLLGYFFGDILKWFIPFVKWPIDLVIAYILGAVISALAAYYIFNKWRASLVVRSGVAIILFILIIVASIVINLEMLQSMKIRAAEVLG